VSGRFLYRGFVTQVFQKLALQWQPDLGQAVPVNVFDELTGRTMPWDLIEDYGVYEGPSPTKEDAPAVSPAAEQELRALTGEYFGYHHDLPRKDRDAAAEKWTGPTARVENRAGDDPVEVAGTVQPLRIARMAARVQGQVESVPVRAVNDTSRRCATCSRRR